MRSGASATNLRHSKTRSVGGAAPSPPSPPATAAAALRRASSRCTAARPSGDEETSTPTGAAAAGLRRPSSSRCVHIAPLARRRACSARVRLRARWPLIVRMCSAIRGRHGAACAVAPPPRPRASAQRSACSTAGVGRMREASSGPKTFGRAAPGVGRRQGGSSVRGASWGELLLRPPQPSELLVRRSGSQRGGLSPLWGHVWAGGPLSQGLPASMFHQVPRHRARSRARALRPRRGWRARST